VLTFSRLALFEQIAEPLSDALAHTSAWSPLILFAASFVEYVFPIFPGDALVLLGAWYAVHGKLSWPLCFAVVTAGAVLGAFVDYQIGRALGARLDRRAGAGGKWAARIARFEASYQKYGSLLLLANRFLPGVRAFLFVAAGACRLPLWKVLALGTVSAAVWNALLLAAGGLVVRSVPELSTLFSRYTAVALLLLLVGAVLLVLQARRPPEPPAPQP
jgi:membrane-associated protein